MKDRVPKYPGRVKLVPVTGQENTFDMTRADEPTQPGDPLSKATFLTDATAALFGLDENAVPDDVFQTIKSVLNEHDTSIANGVKIAIGSYTGTGKYGSSNPNSIALGFQAKAFLVVGGTITMVCPNLTTSYQMFTAYGWNNRTSVSGGFNIRVNGNNVQFYSDSGTTPAGTWYPVFQMNQSSVTYSYIAIG